MTITNVLWLVLVWVCLSLYGIFVWRIGPMFDGLMGLGATMVGVAFAMLGLYTFKGKVE